MGMRVNHTILPGDLKTDILDNREHYINILQALVLYLLPDSFQPGYMGLIAVNRKPQQFSVKFPEFLLHCRKSYELCSTDRSEITGMAEEYNPFTFVIFREIYHT